MRLEGSTTRRRRRMPSKCVTESGKKNTKLLTEAIREVGKKCDRFSDTIWYESTRHPFKDVSNPVT